MAKSLQQIRQNLTALQEQATQLSTELNDLYRQYLESLSQSVHKQLILAVYQICTQIYPEEFLKLSYSQREKFQEKIRNLGKGIQPKLLAYLSLPQPVPKPTITEQQIFIQLSGKDPSFQLPELPEENEIYTIKTPEDLVNWCKKIEQGIRIILDELSQEVNSNLQKAQIISSNLPPQLLEMALQAEEGGMSAGNSPNILNLLVETSHKEEEEEEEEDEDQPSKITKISAIHLRLSEIEFADPQLSIQRKGIMKQLEMLKRMRKAYILAQQDYAQAEAEAAWRSSWHE
ncbi:hypothetical protein VB715_10075 [Crocosphaera sp. UHCC 0190]|uniref:hypothetical protein n=1 Tax=Crocosphaera sp. UHCC 0190 TaxID=3110246 RepID=UPI002B20484B|nr:hypothetical protein [Crocosphaera sp. UHCC 0190]MEA5510108.1 hypothetical protein [Crocosphaera sp. UHCC 0190]